MKSSWYREPWAWLVFILPFTAVVAGITTYIIANTDPDTLVVGDYYKTGKAINLQVAKVKKAQKLGMRFALQFSNSELIIKPTGIEKTFPLLNVNFFHPTLVRASLFASLSVHLNTASQQAHGAWQTNQNTKAKSVPPAHELRYQQFHAFQFSDLK